MARILAMFPGQGSQSVGMGKELLAHFPYVKTVFEEAEDATHLNVRKLCFEGPDEELKLTANTQPAILTVSVATWRVMVSEAGLSPFLYAGHSLGEYAAIVAAGKLDLSQAAVLVRRRGEAMQNAVPVGVGAMAAVMNVAADDLVARCARASSGHKVVEVVNYNAPQQLVVAGHKSAVDALCHQLEADGLRFVLLPVSAPFHSSLMRPAREEMAPLLQQAVFKETPEKVIANLTGDVAAAYGPQQLIEQISSPVKWMQSLETAVKHGCEIFVEIGPGRVLFGLARRSLPKTAKILHSEEPQKTIADLRDLV